MKKTIKLIGIIAIVAVIGFSMVSCDDDDPVEKVITLPKSVSGELTPRADLNQSVTFSILSFNTITDVPVPNAGSVTITTNLPSPNNSFTLTANSGNEFYDEKRIYGLTSGQKVTFTATTTTGGLDLFVSEEYAAIRISLDGKIIERLKSQ